MESPFPVLLVAASVPPPSLIEALRGHGLEPRQVDADEAIRLVASGAADAVLCTESRGWRLLLSRLAAAGALAVLLVEQGVTRVVPTGAGVASSAAEAVAVLGKLRAERAPERRGSVAPTLEQRLAEAERFAAEVQALHLLRTPEEIAWEAVQRARETSGADRVLCWLVGDEARLTLGAADPPLPAPPQSLPIGEGLAGLCAAESIPQTYLEGAAPANVVASVATRDGLQPGPMTTVPLLRGGELVGVLEAVRRAGRAPFDEPELRRLLAWAVQVGTALSGAMNTARLHEAQSEALAANAALEAKVELRTRAVVHAKREWERTFDAIREPIALQEGFIIRRANLAYAEAAGVPITQVPGKTCHQLLAGRVAPCVGCPMGAAEADGLTAEIALQGGRTVRVSGFRVDPGAMPDRVVLHYRDVTAERALEAKVREAERLASVGQLAQGAAQEIQGPLGVLLANIRSIRDSAGELEVSAGSIERAARLCGQSDPAGAVRALTEVQVRELARDLAAIVQDALAGGQRIEAIVRALRELARQDAGRPGPIDVNGCLERAMAAEIPEGAELHSAAQRQVRMLPVQLEQTVVQLLRNARQAGGAAPVRVRSYDEGDQVVIEVRDGGAGIAAAHLSRIFEPFFTTRGGAQGIGLGLTLAWGIVQRAGGRIDVRSAPGAGTTFMVRLPAVPIQAPVASGSHRAA
jgi:signal transduction histidine kinase